MHLILKSSLTICLFLLLSARIVIAQEELHLWPGKAPGSEDWSMPETVTATANGDRIVANVSNPTLAVYLPDPATATGTAIVIAPGGALRVLAYDNEGVKVAEWLNRQGIAAFVLKYRTLQENAGAGPPRGFRAPGDGPRAEIDMPNANANPAPDNGALAEVLGFAVADAQQALRLVRSNATDWHVNPARVGIMGFSAGGGVAIGTALAEHSDAYPDFLVTLYGPSLMDVHVPEYAPPLFIAVGATHFNVTKGCLALFTAWRAAGKPVEMHVYDRVSAGFGMSQHGLPVDRWTDRLHEWLLARGITAR